MTETVDGVRDPQRVNKNADRAYYRYPLDPFKEEFEAVVDDEGYVRYPEGHKTEGKPLGWAGTILTRTEKNE